MRTEILKYLSDSYEHKAMNDFLLKNFKDASLKSIAIVLSEMYSTLPELQSENVIKIKAITGNFNTLGVRYNTKNDILGIFSASTNPNDPIFDLTNTIFTARILDKGRKELAEHELRDSIQQVNNSVKITNNTTRILAILASVLAAASLVYNIWFSSTEIPQLKKTNEILQNQVNEIQQLNKKLPLLDSSKKHKF